MTTPFGTDTDFQFRVFDVLKSYDFKVKTERMMIDGSKFSDMPDTCYIPIFYSGVDSTEQDKNTIWVGNVFMQNYYVVYDMSNYVEETGAGYLQVGIGNQATYNKGVARLYDRSS
jgi:hypothetical protein